MSTVRIVIEYDASENQTEGMTNADLAASELAYWKDGSIDLPTFKAAEHHVKAFAYVLPDRGGVTTHELLADATQNDGSVL